MNETSNVDGMRFYYTSGGGGALARVAEIENELRALRAELAQARAEQRQDAGDGQGALDEANGEIERLRAELAAMTAERDELRREFRGMVDEAEQRANSIVAQEDAFIKDLCERLGYGAVMDSAARQWYLKNPDGAFVVAGCACVVRRLAAGAKNTDYYTANEADAEAAEERVMLMRRDNQRAASARRVAAYCRQMISK